MHLHCKCFKAAMASTAQADFHLVQGSNNDSQSALVVEQQAAELTETAQPSETVWRHSTSLIGSVFS